MRPLPPPPAELAPKPTPQNLPLGGRPKSPRLVVRFTVRLRREGGSLSITVPCHIVRQWKLTAGDRLVVRSGDEGILIYPRYFVPYSGRARRARRAQARAEREAEAQARAASQRSATSAISSITCASVRPDDLRTWKL
jgi:antitoxin component of MazEF toxin-antitoxin module